MPIRLNVFCNGQIAANTPYLDNFDQVNWGPGGVKRDALGLPVFGGEGCSCALSPEEEENANLQE